MVKKDKKDFAAPKLSRRTFLKSLGVSSVTVGAARGESVIGRLQKVGILEKDKIVGPGKVKVKLLVNGKRIKVRVEPRATLAEVLRSQLQLTGTKIGCDRGACGACTVIMGGKAVSSCMTLALDAVGHPIETIEGLALDKEKLDPIQEAFIEYDALQCGFCTSGMIMSSKHLLDHNKQPSIEDIKTAVSGNICRCGTYANVFKAVESAAKKTK
jgi:aerobic-type carbon monoxide dehydrogenase small subunit (CoxS/CutS family)